MIFGDLLKKPLAFLLFYNLFVKKTDELPQFADRSKASKTLINLKLAKTIHEKKHRHRGQISLTQDGIAIGKEFTEKEIFKKFENIEIKSREKFDETFQKEFFPKYKLNYEESDILVELELPKIGVWMKRQGKQLLKLEGWRYLDSKNHNKFEFKFRIKCNRCDNEFEVTHEIIYYEEEYNARPFSKFCPNCECEFYSDDYFKSFDMYCS